MKNFKYTALVIDDGTDKVLGTRVFATENALSNYANRWYRKNNKITVIAYYFGTEKIYSTYHE